LNKKSAQKQKRLLETTASRKPLFHEKTTVKQHENLQKQSVKDKIIP